jgi:rhodanese-related sulfurtransferase
MIKISKKQITVSLALIVALILAFFPTSGFVSNSFVVDSHLKQQPYNNAGLFTITSFEATKYYGGYQSTCYWLDIRDASDFSSSHLSVAVNKTMTQLKNTTWNPDDLILIYGNNTEDAQHAASYLRQVQNARAFAIEGGYTSIKKYLVDPIGLTILNQFSESDLSTLLEVRKKLYGKETSAEKSIEKPKIVKSKTLREGC